VLAELARGKLRKKIPALREALQGRFEALHALLIGAILSHLDFLGEQITSLSQATRSRSPPFRRGPGAADDDPGRRTAHR